MKGDGYSTKLATENKIRARILRKAEISLVIIESPKRQLAVY